MLRLVLMLSFLFVSSASAVEPVISKEDILIVQSAAKEEYEKWVPDLDEVKNDTQIYSLRLFNKETKEGSKVVVSVEDVMNWLKNRIIEKLHTSEENNKDRLGLERKIKDLEMIRFTPSKSDVKDWVKKEFAGKGVVTWNQKTIDLGILSTNIHTSNDIFNRVEKLLPIYKTYLCEYKFTYSDLIKRVEKSKDLITYVDRYLLKSDYILALSSSHRDYVIPDSRHEWLNTIEQLLGMSMIRAELLKTNADSIIKDEYPENC